MQIPRDTRITLMYLLEILSRLTIKLYVFMASHLDHVTSSVKKEKNRTENLKHNLITGLVLNVTAPLASM